MRLSSVLAAVARAVKQVRLRQRVRVRRSDVSTISLVEVYRRIWRQPVIREITGRDR